LPDSDEAEAELELQFASEEVANADASDPIAEEANNNTTNDSDAHGRMPGQLPTVADVVDNDSTVRDYTTVKRLAKERIAALLGTTVTISAARRSTITWKVVEKHMPPDERTVEAGFEQKKQFGIINFDAWRCKKSEVLAGMFLQLSFLNWKEKVDAINNKIIASRRKIKKFPMRSF
jgi:hypothetical protein